MKIAPFLVCISASAFCSVTLFAAGTHAPAINDQQFIQTAAQTDMLEAHVTQMAEKQSSRKGIKDFSASASLDDTTNYQSLCSIANNLGLPVPKGIDAQGNKLVDELTKAKTGHQFDRRFVRQEVNTDQQAVAAYEQEAQSGQNPALKSFASKQLPTVKLHLYEAQDLAKATSRS
jgi:putative membrane protein